MSVIPTSTSSSSIPILQYAVSADLLAAAILCLTVAICFVLLYNILSNITHWLRDTRPRHVSSEAAVFRRIVVHYNAFVRDVDDRRAQRLRDSNRLPPLIRYEGSEKGLLECVICLEDFEDGESCQVFPVCNHVFHTLCIDHWLKNRPTCPLCRNCILEV